MARTIDDRINTMLEKAQTLEELSIERAACRQVLHILSGVRYEKGEDDPWGDCSDTGDLEDSYTVVFNGNYGLRIMRGTRTSQLIKQAVTAELERIEDVMNEIMKEEI